MFLIRTGIVLSFYGFMGLARVFYGKFGEKINLTKVMLGCRILCAICYLLVSLSPFPIIGLIGCSQSCKKFGKRNKN